MLRCYRTTAARPSSVSTSEARIQGAANATVAALTEVGYDGSYGNKTVVFD